MGGKDEAPKGPDFNKLIEQSMKFVSENQDLFAEAMKFGKNQFSKGDEWVQRLTDFGTDAMGKLNAEADKFGKDVAGRVAGLDKAGTKWGKAATDIYGKNKAIADKITGKLMPGMGAEAELGTEMLRGYREKGIAEQDKFRDKLGGWDTSARREDRAAQAVSDIALTTEAAREAELRKLESYGINPGQTRSAALDSRLRAANAIAKAGAANLERGEVEREGLEYGKVASDLWDARRAGGLEGIEAAAGTGRSIAEIARQPGADYLTQLAALGQYGIGTGQLEQAGGRSEYDMRTGAAGFGERGTAAGATQQNTNANYGSNLYDQGSRGIRQSADITQGAYSTGGQLNANDIARVAENNKNSFGGTLGTLAGVAAPFVLDSFAPGLGSMAKAATAGAKTMFGRPAAGTNLQNDIYAAEGGPIPKEASPSFGILPDDVSLKATPGEYVMDEDTVRWFGEKYFADLQAKARKGRGIPETASA